MPQTVAPFGGVERRFSTAPYCVGVPRPGMDPLVLDFATSIVAEGKVLVASQGGKKVPDGALVGPDGNPSADPHLLYGDYTPTGPRDHSKGTGAIRAFGDHKGSGLAFMCEILGGSLSGTGATDPKRGRFANGMLSFYIDPKVFDAEGFFPGDIARYVAFVKSSKPAKAGGEILAGGKPVRIAPFPALTLTADAALLRRALFNLVENAAKYAPGPVHIRARTAGPRVEIDVVDSGPGFPPGREAQLFDKFERGDRESATPGVGLGLAICKAIVEAHGGQISAHNVATGGACVRVELPLGQPPA